MPFFRKRVVENRAALILAGGDGTRLRDLTRFIMGANVPKQFCPIIGDSTLLDQTRNRVAALIPPERTAIVLNRMHRRFYGPLLTMFLIVAWSSRAIIEEPQRPSSTDFAGWLISAPTQPWRFFLPIISSPTAAAS